MESFLDILFLVLIGASGGLIAGVQEALDVTYSNKRKKAIKLRVFDAILGGLVGLLCALMYIFEVANQQIDLIDFTVIAFLAAYTLPRFFAQTIEHVIRKTNLALGLEGEHKHHDR